MPRSSASGCALWRVEAASPSGQLTPRRGRVVLVDLQGRIPPRVIGLVWHRDRHLSPAGEAFVDTARSVCLELGAESAAA